MKNQYFADRRDFLKYELLLDLAELTSPRRLLSVLMLTPDDGTAEGSVTSYEAGLRRPELHAFLKDCLGSGTRRVSLLRAFMSDAAVDYLPYRDDDDCFGGDGRAAYFSSCAGLARDHRLIFFDPDIGLENPSASYMRRQGIEKYLMCDELAAIAAAAPPDAVFVVYQHLQKNKRLVRNDIGEKCRALCRVVRSPSAAFATDRDVAFLVTSRVSEACSAAIRVVRSHGRHGLEVGEVEASDEASSLDPVLDRREGEKRMAMGSQPEQDEWSEWPFVISDETLAVVRAALEETPLIVEHRFYRGSRAPERAVFDDFEALDDFIRSKGHAGDSLWLWRFSDLCRDENALVWGKVPDKSGKTPRGGAY